MNPKPIVSLFVSSVLAAVTVPAEAETLFPALRDTPTRFGIGLGALVEDEGYVEVGTEVEPVPVLLVQYGRFRLFGPQAEFRLFGDEQRFFGLRADYRLDGYDEEDGDIFAGMAERKAALSFGVSGRYSAGFGDLSFDLVQATSSERGMRGGLYYSYPIDVGQRLKFLPRIGLEYFDDDFVDYYYGVRPEEALATRAAYEGRSTLNIDVGVDVHYDLGEHHGLLGSIKYRSFGSEIEASPLIEDSGSLRVNVGYLYRF